MGSNTFFDKEAEKWSERYAQDARFARRFARLTTLISKYLPAAGFSALDAGCGSGVFSRWLHACGGKVTAIDPSREMIQHAREESTSSDIIFVESDILQFTSAEKFDVVIALSMLEYVPKQERALDRLTSLSEHILVVSVPNRTGMVRRIERLVLVLRKLTGGAVFAKRGEYLRHQRYQWRSVELDAALAQRDFRKIDQCYVGTSIGLPNSVLPILEREWWAAMYCAVYVRSTTLSERADRA